MQSLVLGTAQWGQKYGITNTHGMPDDAEIQEMADLARSHGIRRIDTAAGYGQAHGRLRPYAKRFEVGTKVFAGGRVTIEQQVREALTDLQVSTLDTCLIHDWSRLPSDYADRALADLQWLKGLGLVTRVGASGYDEADTVRALNCPSGLNVLQLPANALDRRLENAQPVVAAKAQGIVIQARSVFLQGLLLTRSSTAQGQHPDILRWHDWCASHGTPPLIAALGHVKAQGWIDEVVVGVASAAELRDLLGAWQAAEPRAVPADWASSDTRLLDPRTWDR